MEAMFSLLSVASPVVAATAVSRDSWAPTTVLTVVTSTMSLALAVAVMAVGWPEMHSRRKHWVTLLPLLLQLGVSGSFSTVGNILFAPLALSRFETNSLYCYCSDWT